MSYSDGPRGIGGWLTIFLFTRAVAPIFAAAIACLWLYAFPWVAASFGARWSLFQTTLWSIVAVIAAIDWYCVWRFVRRRHWLTVQISIGLLGTLALIELIVVPLELALAADVPVGDILRLALTPGWIVPVLLPNVLWAAYLLASKRVANTYPRHYPADSASLPRVFE